MLIYPLILIATLLSGWFDSRGFLHADKTWSSAGFSSSELFHTYFNFFLGIAFYLLAIKFTKTVINISPTLQTAAWFVTVMIGLAISSGNFFQWKRVEQVVSIAVLTGIIWLIFQGKQ